MSLSPRSIRRLLLIVLLLNTVILGGLALRMTTIDERVEALEQETAAHNAELIALAHNRTTPSGVYAANRTVSVTIPTYNPRSFSGELATAHIRSLPGEGTYIRVDRLDYYAATQESIRAARTHAEQSPYHLPYGSMYVAIDGPNHWKYIDGKSGTLALTLGMMALDPAVRLNESVAITGNLNADGEVTRVQRIPEKAETLRAAGYDVLLVPPGQAYPVEGIRMIEVENVTEAAGYALVS